MQSEEVTKLNVALKYCDLLKNNLQASILHVQMLNRKYNTKEYIQPLNTFVEDSPRKNISLQQNKYQPKMQNEKTRSLKEVKNNFNNIIVTNIKVQREVETVVTQLNLLGKAYKKEHPSITKRKMQSASYSFTDSPIDCRHRRCYQNLSDVSRSRDKSQSAVHLLNKNHHSFGGSSYEQDTPKRKRSEQLIHSRLVKGKIDFEVNEIISQSTPLKVNSGISNSASSSSCFLSDSIMNDISLPNTSELYINDQLNGTANATMIKTCFRTFSTSPKREQLHDTPKRIRWTPILKVKKVSIYY